MRMLLGIVLREDTDQDQGELQSRLAHLERRLPRFVAHSFPADQSNVKSDSWRNAAGNVRLYGWTNEPVSADSPLIHRTSSATVGRAGYLCGGVTEADFCEDPYQIPIARRAGGCFAIFRADRNSLQATTDVTRSNGLYWGETNAFRVVSTRALLTHLILESDLHDDSDPKLDFDLFSVRTFASVGYFMGNLTPYRGVQAVDESAVLRLDGFYSRLTRDPVEAGVAADPSDESWRSLIDESCGLLVEAFEPTLSDFANLSLTGGRDSRLLAAAMVASGKKDFRTATSGVPGHPDVDLAVQIAKILQMEHVLRPPAADDEDFVLAEDPLARIVRNLDVHDGFTSAWDDVPTYGPMSMRATISGVGGEIMRGGLVLQDLNALDRSVAVQRVRNTMTGGGVHFQSRWMTRAAAYAAPWVELAASDPHSAIDRFYHVHRNGRWVSARRSGVRFRAFAVDPLLDNRLVRSVLRVDPQSRWSERLVFDMIKHLAPQIANLPLEGERWRFERNEPLPTADAAERETWSLRSGIKASTQVGRYYWHTLGDDGMRQRVKAIVAERMDGLPKELFASDAILDQFDQDSPAPPAFLWHLATTCVLLSDRWHATSRPDRVCDIPIRVRG